MSSIIEMPDLVLEHIIGFLDFRTVFTLRQVCKDFRIFIDDLKKSKLPDSKFKSINVFLENEKRIRLAFMWDYNSQIEISRYFTKKKPSFFESISQEMCSKCFGNKKIRSEQEDLKRDRVLEYLKFVLKSQKSTLQNLTFQFYIRQSSIIFTKLTHILEPLNEKFKTGMLKIFGTQGSQFSSILPLIDSENIQVARILPVDPVLHFAINSEMDQVKKQENMQQMLHSFIIKI